jgi:hypothetical protein
VEKLIEYIYEGYTTINEEQMLEVSDLCTLLKLEIPLKYLEQQSLSHRHDPSAYHTDRVKEDKIKEIKKKKRRRRCKRRHENTFQTISTEKVLFTSSRKPLENKKHLQVGTTSTKIQETDKQGIAIRNKVRCKTEEDPIVTIEDNPAEITESIYHKVHSLDKYPSQFGHCNKGVTSKPFKSPVQYFPVAGPNSKLEKDAYRINNTMYICNKCDYSTSTQDTLSGHNRSVHVKYIITKDHACNQCGNTTTKFKINNTCDQCGHIYSAKSRLNEDKRISNDAVKEYTCDQCIYSELRTRFRY